MRGVISIEPLEAMQAARSASTSLRTLTKLLYGVRDSIPKPCLREWSHDDADVFGLKPT
jgi:hypothetical protein